MGSEPSDLSEAKTLGDYALIRRIAIGGMAEIYEARRLDEGEDAEHLVVKVLLPQHVKDAELIRMMEHEAKVNIALAHPGLIRVYGLEHAGGQPFMVMELVEGIALSDLTAAVNRSGGSIPAPTALRIVADLLDTLVHVHEAKGDDGAPLGIVHRDVTPHNIMISRDGKVRLGDFGIARSNLRDTRTRTGIIKGKLRYMAPEQITGSAIDARTDLYAVGLIFWELLLGTPYIRGVREVDLLRSAEAPEFRRPSTVGELDPRYDGILKRALGRFPEERFGDAASFRRALEEIIFALGPPADDEALAALAQTALDGMEKHRSDVHDGATRPALDSSPHTRKVARPKASQGSGVSPFEATRLSSSKDAPGRGNRSTTLLLSFLILTLFGAWLGPSLFESEAAVPQPQPAETQIADEPAEAETIELIAEAPDSSVAVDAGAAPIAAREEDEGARPAAAISRTQPPVTRTPIEREAQRRDAAVAATEEPSAVEPASPSDDAARRSALASQLRDIRGELGRRGLSLVDLSPEQRAAYQGVSRALGAGELDSVAADLPGLGAELRAVPIDRALVQRKLDRVNARIRAVRTRGVDTTQFEALATTALQEFMNQRYEATNRRLNELMSLLAAAH